MSKFKPTIFFAIVMFLATSSLVVFISTAKASELPKPVPSFDNINELATVTTIEVPENLINAWRGVYHVNISPLLQIQSANFRQYLENYLKPQLKPVTQKRTFKYNPSAIYKWTDQLAKSINRQTKEPVLEIKDNRVVKFSAPQTGQELDRFNSTISIIEQLQEGDKTVTLVVRKTNPKTELSTLNKLGIKELVGRGESKFTGSPKNRQHNIKVGIERMKGVILAPGEVFSFNKFLGPVEESTGFLPELVIRADKGTVPEFGGGLCQVSSTVFRAAMHAGLKINERRNHSYAVQYYAPQGTDATIYPGVVDLRFTNDTGHHIMIWPYLKQNDYLVFDFYGTHDGRKVVLDKPVQWDKKADGSMKASWSRTIINKDGNAKTDKYSSLYKPPALFQRRDEFVSAPVATTPQPETNNPGNQEAVKIEDGKIEPVIEKPLIEQI